MNADKIYRIKAWLAFPGFSTLLVKQYRLNWLHIYVIFILLLCCTASTTWLHGPWFYPMLGCEPRAPCWRVGAASWTPSSVLIEKLEYHVWALLGNTGLNVLEQMGEMSWCALQAVPVSAGSHLLDGLQCSAMGSSFHDNVAGFTLEAILWLYQVRCFCVWVEADAPYICLAHCLVDIWSVSDWLKYDGSDLGACDGILHKLQSSSILCNINYILLQVATANCNQDEAATIWIDTFTTVRCVATAAAAAAASSWSLAGSGAFATH